MQLNGASNVLRDADDTFEWDGLSLAQFVPSIDSEIIEKAAEALYAFVFSGCDRLDGGHRWRDCDEDTRAGFRREVEAVTTAVTSAPNLLASFGVMTDVVFKTWRAHRNLVERLRGFDKVYETEISDGERSVRGRGRTKRESQVAAQRNWITQFGAAQTESVEG